MNWALSQPHVSRQRRLALAPARGRVLEIGFGTGLNLAWYPPQVSHLTAIDANAAMLRWVAGVSSAAFPITFEKMDSRALPFESKSFDCVVSTWTLCSIRDVEQALLEVRRVLKSDGEFLFVEHGRSPEPNVSRWQTRLNPLQRRLGDGCHLDRPMGRLIQQAGFAMDRLEEFYLERTPRLMGYTYRGVASPLEAI